MYHPVLLNPHLPHEGPAAPERARAPEAAACEPCYRSEAFAEDLPHASPPSPVAQPGRQGRQGGLTGLPFGGTLATAVLGMLGSAQGLRG